MEFGLDTFGDVTRGADGRPQSHAQTIRDVIEEAELAGRVGVDYIGVREHHREDFAIFAPEVVLAAIAARTTRIRMGSAVRGAHAARKLMRCIELYGTRVKPLVLEMLKS